jgi:hypothetical protein
MIGGTMDAIPPRRSTKESNPGLAQKAATVPQSCAPASKGECERDPGALSSGQGSGAHVSGMSNSVISRHT